MTPTAPQQPAATAGLGKFHFIAELARGGMGNVYLAALSGPGGFHKLLAIKELKPELADDPVYVAMFLEEARLAARLVHPNIVQTNEVVSDAQSHYMVMEYLDGRSLSQVGRRLAREGGLDTFAYLRVLCSALLGLHHAHELCGFDGEPLGIVHRDVSPLNLMVTFDGQAKLLDFGIAKAIDSPLETRAGILKGRIAYMAPEQACGERVDRRADVYSVGVMVWEAVARRRLWPSMSEVEILSKLLSEGPPRLGSVVPGAPADLDAVCGRAMARDPSERYTTAAELMRDLEGCLARRGDRTTTREVGERAGAVFAEERHQLNRAIDAALVGLGAARTSGVMPAAARVSFVGTPSAAWPVRADSPGPSSSRVALAHRLDHAPAIWRGGSTPDTPRSAPTVPELPRRRRWKTRVLAGCVCAGLVLASAIVAWAPVAPPRSVAGPSNATPAAAVEPTARPLTPPPAPVDRVSSDPSPRDPSPPTASVVPRRSIAPAPAAAAPKTPRHPPAPSPSTTSPEAAASAPLRVDLNPTGGRAPLRPIVTSNPYGSP